MPVATQGSDDEAQRLRLLRREAVDIASARTLKLPHVCVIRNRCAAKVRNVLAKRELAIYMYAWRNLILSVLRTNHCSACGELRLVFFRPPALKISALVELTSFVIEPVCYLVPDDRAHGAVVNGIIRFGIKERWL